MKMQQDDYNDALDQTPTPQSHQQDYTTNINELISQPVSENIYMAAATYVLKELYQLSTYLFTKQMKQNNSLLQGESFDQYLSEMDVEMGRLRRAGSKGLAAREAGNMEAELVRCFQKVDSIYFQENYFLDFSYFELIWSQLKRGRSEDKGKVKQQLQSLCESLDLVEINLFSQIHCKFHEYFAAAANFQYLQDSVAQQLQKLNESRRRMARVKAETVEKSVRLRQKLVQRQNIQKLLKTIKLMKSVKKLPQVIESILASSLPYECLSLLQQTKGSLASVSGLRCMGNTAESVHQMQVLTQNDLTKRYVNELYLYLQECHAGEGLVLVELWDRIEVGSCLDKDNSMIIDQLNSSTNSLQSQGNMMLEQIQNYQKDTRIKLGSTSLIPRHEGKEYQIAMILLQSYQYISFTPEVTKIKVCTALRAFTKKYQKQLLSHLHHVIQQQLIITKQNNHLLSERATTTLQREPEVPVAVEEGERGQEEEVGVDVVEKVSVEYYSKHVGVLNDIFRETVNRFLGYLLTLLTEYEEEVMGAGADWQPGQNENKFKHIFRQECSLLPSIFKIIQQKVKHLLTLKNISSITPFQFYQWINTFKYWQRYFDYLVDEHPLLNHSPHPGHTHPQATQAIQELCRIVRQNLSRAMATMGLETLLYDLTVGYINANHKNTLSNQIVGTLQDDTWQSTQIPPQFSDILNNILNPEGMPLNASITILDSSTSSQKHNTSRDSSSSKQLSRQQMKEEGRMRIKFKLLKNSILVGGVRFKVNLSFLVLCETMGEYIRMNRILGGILSRDAVESAGHNRITRHIYLKLYQMIEKFTNVSKELILQTKALQFGKIKGKNINAKHICLLCNAISITLKIAEELLEQKQVQVYGLGKEKESTVTALQNAHLQLITKLSLILNSKIQKDINDHLNLEKTHPNNHPELIAKTNKTIITAFLQMVEITDEYLQADSIRSVLKHAFQTLSQRYFTHLLLKGGKWRGEVQILAEKLKFMRKYFANEYEALLREIPSSSPT